MALVLLLTASSSQNTENYHSLRCCGFYSVGLDWKLIANTVTKEMPISHVVANILAKKPKWSI